MYGDSIIQKGNEFFCNVCQITLSKKPKDIRQHVSSKQHKFLIPKVQAEESESEDYESKSEETFVILPLALNSIKKGLLPKIKSLRKYISSFFFLLPDF